MVPTNQKPMVDSQKIKERNLDIALGKIINSKRKVARDEEMNKGTIKHTEKINIMTLVSLYLYQRKMH